MNNKIFKTLVLSITCGPLFFSPSGLLAQTDTTSFVSSKPLFDFDARKMPFQLTGQQKINKTRMLRLSMVTGYREGVSPVSGFANFASYLDNNTNTRRIYMYNLSIQDMLTHGFFNSSHVILEVKNPSQYRYDPVQGNHEQWLRKNGYCYELVVPEGVPDLSKLMNSELARIFNVKFGREKRLTDALVLIRTSSVDKIKSAGKGESRYNQQGFFNNITLDKLKSILYLREFLPLVDETGYTGRVDIDLQMEDGIDLQTLRNRLKQYDLDIIPAKREVEMFVIRENNYSTI